MCLFSESFQGRSSPSAQAVRKRLANGDSSPPRSNSVDKKLKKESNGRDSVERQDRPERTKSPLPFVGSVKHGKVSLLFCESASALFTTDGKIETTS